ncbi:hypothetical protein [Sandaracinus amylolyticus]|uniref:Uncharacterized protein n=1 Tax=Sandaracinus amylolyticus TaxID=927083 RepID=A0A0F6YI88_9BACT|nr:hypothetical protein [Sandaracinus amylolyticus]AKF05635.1 hypothetical protein DB32_002784 [Sandaracinus amylolyticus]
MNTLEDAFWSARASALAAQSHGRAAIVVKRGKRLAEAVTSSARQAAIHLAILDAGAAARGATVYLAQAPTRDALELASRARVQRIVVPAGAEIARELEDVASSARVTVTRAVADHGSPWPVTDATIARRGAREITAKMR